MCTCMPVIGNLFIFRNGALFNTVLIKLFIYLYI